MTIKRTPNTINTDPGIHINTTWIPFISPLSDHTSEANEHTNLSNNGDDWQFSVSGPTDRQAWIMFFNTSNHI